MNNGLRGIAAPIGIANQRYKPSLKKARSRPADEKLREIVSVKDFGAIGDGIADDYAAIQAAIDAAPGGAAWFPYTPTGYRCTNGFSFGRGLGAQPVIRAKQLIGEAYVRLFFDNLPNTTDAVTMHWDTFAGIEGITIDMGNPDASDAVYSDGRDGLRIRGGEWGYLDVQVINCGRDGIHFEGAAAGEWHENFNGKIRVFNCGRDGIHFRLPNLTSVFVNECRFQMVEIRRWKRHAVHAADSDEVAHRFRFEAARDSDFISPIIPR